DGSTQTESEASPSAGETPADPTPQATAPQSPIQVKMTLTAQSWLRITSDGQTEFEGILQPGDSRLWTADQALTIRAGNAGAVMVSYNDRQAEALGQPGMVREITFSPAEAVSLAW
ncbi:helix-turn-helix domain-containing protein, partial [filamentous cyanobacterium CCP5]